jgi:predicted transcriptional regulator
MTTWEKVLDCLSTKGVPAILILLTKNEKGVNASQILKEISSLGKIAISNAIMCLILSGLLEERREQKYNQRIITLTALGEKVVKHLIAIEKELLTESQ